MSQPATKGKWGGSRPGSGRKLQPSTKALRKMKKYLELTLMSDFKLMAHLALRPKEFDDQVQYAGQEEDGLDKDGKPYTKRTGGYALDPLFKERLSLLKFRLSKFLPDAPREVEINGEMEMVGLPPQMVNMLVQVVQQSKSNSNCLETQSTSAKPSVQAMNTLNGNAISSEILGLLTTSEESMKRNGQGQ